MPDGDTSTDSVVVVVVVSDVEMPEFNPSIKVSVSVMTIVVVGQPAHNCHAYGHVYAEGLVVSDCRGYSLRTDA